MLSDLADSLATNLSAYGLSIEESGLYLALLKQSKTALELHRELKIARTKVYRLLEKLVDKGFVREDQRDYGTMFIAAEPSSLNIIIAQKESELEQLKTNAPRLFNQLAALSFHNTNESRVLHYRGREGLKQVIWNSTKVKGDFRIYEINLMHYLVDQDYSEKVRREFAAKPQNKFLQLTNHTSFEPYTNVSGHVAQWEVRHVPKDQLDIKFEIQIYNDVTCMFEYTADDIFIVEIYNQQLADMQKQIFDFVWKHAKPMKKIGEKGAAILENSATKPSKL